MAEVRLSIGGHEYIVTCSDGEEERLRELGNLVDTKVREAGGSAGGLNESRQLLFASLLLADQLQDAAHKNHPETIEKVALSGTEPLDEVCATLEKLADRIEMLADTLEK